MTELVILADLGRFKAYELLSDGLKMESPRVNLLQSYDAIEAREKISERVTDQAGKFRRAGGRSGIAPAGYGEKHGMEDETKKKLVKETASNINKLVLKSGCGSWCLGAARTINRMIVEALDPGVRAIMRKNLKSDLTKAPKTEILERFAV